MRQGTARIWHSKCALNAALIFRRNVEPVKCIHSSSLARERLLCVLQSLHGPALEARFKPSSALVRCMAPREKTSLSLNSFI